MTPSDELSDHDHAFIEALSRISNELSHVSTLARQFITIVKQGNVSALTAWLNEVRSSELKSFGEGLESDIAAVMAALVYPWSNGQVEGQVNRIKMIKHQMYGRASFDLLRHRVMIAA